MSSVDLYLLQQASCLASLLVTTAGFPRDEWPDVRQELISDCLRRSPKFDPSRGDWEGFVRGVMRNHAKVLIKRRHRRMQREVLAGDISHHDAGAGDVETREDPKTVSGGRHEIEAGIQLSIDIRRLINSMPPKLQEIALRLTESSVLEVSAQTGRSRSGVYKLTRQMRPMFVQAGLGPR
jgi:DNA-directed RNA polymerase specialized sigma24 family protein